jgi:predicted transcriptional regulator
MLIQREQNVKAPLFFEATRSMTDSHSYLLALSAQIVGAHVGNNLVGSEAIPDLIRNVYSTLATLGSETVSVPRHNIHNHEEHDLAETKQEEAKHTERNNQDVHSTYGQTVFGDRIICMEDGLSMKMLKRHLQTVHGLTPDQYRAKWGLPDDYPMVAKDYAKLRSNLALQSGLGLKPEDRPAKPRKARGQR